MSYYTYPYVVHNFSRILIYLGMITSENMRRLKKLISNNKTQYIILSILLIAVIGMTAISNYSNSLIFQKYLGNLNPLIVFLSISILCFMLLSSLFLKNWFIIYRKKHLKELIPHFFLIGLFVLTAIFVDLKIVFPENMNIEFPNSLLFYPAIGFLVEILFHVLPIYVLLSILTIFLKGVSHKKIIWICILIVATIEPTYQAIYMDSSPNWAIIVIWLNLFLFNITQLVIFKKYDFITMYSFRLIYYAFWHIAWGYIRLNLLF